MKKKKVKRVRSRIRKNVQMLVRLNDSQFIIFDKAYQAYIGGLSYDESSITKPEFIRLMLMKACDELNMKRFLNK